MIGRIFWKFSLDEEKSKETEEETSTETNEEVSRQEDGSEKKEEIVQNNTSSVLSIPSLRSDIFSLDSNANPPVDLQEETSEDDIERLEFYQGNNE